MPIALWCVLIAGLMPYAIVPLARGKGFDMRAPRDAYAKQGAAQKRAYAAHLNSFEFFPLFAAAVLVAMLGGAGSVLLDGLAMAWVALRIAYVVAYVKDNQPVRTALAMSALAVSVAIFALPMWIGLVY